MAGPQDGQGWCLEEIEVVREMADRVLSGDGISTVTKD